MTQKIPDPCKNCQALCCKNYTVSLTLKDVINIFEKTKNLDFLSFTAPNEDESAKTEAKFKLEIKGQLVDCIMCLKRDEKEKCYFLSNKNLCRIYDTRPKKCRLYPHSVDSKRKTSQKKDSRCHKIWKKIDKDSKKTLEEFEEWKKEKNYTQTIFDKWNMSLDRKKTFSELIKFCFKQF